MPSPENPPEPTPFPEVTAWSVVLEARDRTSREWKERLNELIALYWKPVWGYLIRRWRCSPEDAGDLTQEFFARIVEENSLQRASPERGRFRTFLKLELRDLVLDDLRRRAALKRGGAVRTFSLDPDVAEPKWTGLQPEEEFDRLWASHLLGSATQDVGRRLASEGKDAVFQAYWNCSVRQPSMTYQECAAALGITVADVGNYAYRFREQLRKEILQRIRQSVVREEEVEQELQYILDLLKRA